MKRLHILGVILAIALTIFGVVCPIPEKYVYVSSSSSAYHSDWKENTGAGYLGGDAYNYIVEASLKAGYLNSVVTTKCFSIAVGILLFFLSLFSGMKNDTVARQTETIERLIDYQRDLNKGVSRLEEQVKKLALYQEKREED
ncbi:MAG: hypothetical protein E7317_00265 [Clostridiales bacterium]|nr:hypothetical protein [Clostridiales bacterium]